MFSIYLSPSTQDWNLYLSGNSEEYYMNQIADALVPYLDTMGIQYVRNTPDMTAASSIAQSNMGDYDLHIALHSNAAPESQPGSRQGVEVYYYPTSLNGKIMAEITADYLKGVYPDPEKVTIIPTTTLGEVRRTKAPTILIEYAYHDNPQDEAFIINNIDTLARATAQAIAEYFDIAFQEPTAAAN